MGNRRGRLTILLALVIATAAAYVAYAAVGGSDDEPGTEAAAVAAPTSVPTDGILVAIRDIPAATTLTADMVEIRQIALDEQNSRALTKPEQAIGLLTAVPLFAGEQVLDTRLTEQPADPETFAPEIPVGTRAMSLVFTEVQGGYSGLVQPGDHVDVIAYFEFEVKDGMFQGSDEDEDEDDDGESDDDSDSDDGEVESVEYEQYVAVFVVQNVQVLTVAQALSPEEIGIGDREPERPVTEAEEAVDEASAEESPEAAEPKSRPDAKSVTLAVTPEQAQRLLLATQTTWKPDGLSLRLIVRAPGDTTIYDLPPAQLGEIPIGGLLGDVPLPMTPTEVLITDVEFTKRVVSSGEILEFSATVKNVSDRTIRSGADAPPEYIYTQGIAYDDLGFFAEADTYRIGLNVAGAYPTPFPYRWGLGRDLAPGESTTLVGSVQLTEPIPETRYWLGVIQEQDVVTQDGVGVTDITVLATESVTVNTQSAELLITPEPGAQLLRVLDAGEQLDVLGVRGPWFRVRIDDQEGWIPAQSILSGDESSSIEQGENEARPVVPVTVVVTETTSRLLTAPRPNAPVVAEVAQGDRLAVLGVEGGWFRVLLGNREGWIPATSITAAPDSLDGEAGPTGAASPQEITGSTERWNPWR